MREAAPVNPQARWLVGVATGTSLMAAVWVSKAAGGGVVPYTICASLNATPLLAREPKPFVTACRIGALVVVLAGLFGPFWRLFYFWPAAALLVLASHAAYGHGRTPRLLLTSGAIAGIVAAGGWATAIYQTALRPADAYLVTFESESAARTAADAGNTNGSALGFGAIGVSQKDRVWDVSFRPGLTPEQRVQLEKRLGQLPGVSRVGLCSRWKGEC